jgi:6-phosphogluconolactonase
MRLGRVLVVGFALLAAVGGVVHAAGGRLVWIGTYTGPTSEGIYAFRFDESSGVLQPLGLAARTRNPSFIVLHPNRRFLYAVNEVHDVGAEKGGEVTAFAVDRDTGKLTQLNAQPSHGTDPCHLAVDATGRFLAVANYSSGSLAIFPVGEDGRLGKASTIIRHTGTGPNKARQEGPHAHDVVFDRDNRHLVQVDLGTDQLYVYDFDARTGKVTLANAGHVAAGAGPRHFAFHPDGRRAYVINELASTVTAMTWDSATGTLMPGASVSTLPSGFTGENTTAEVAVGPDGHFLYGSYRGHDSIAVFDVRRDGPPALVEHVPSGGRTPRSFAIAPGGHWLIAANQQSDSLVVFRVDPASGRLTAAGSRASVGSPVCVLFDPAE